MTSDAAHHVFDCKEIPIQKVIVYNDRAELKRTLKVELKEGNNEVNIMNLTNQVLSDSVRVNGFGNAIIHEVQVAQKYVNESDKESQQVKALRSQVEEVQVEVAVIEDKININKTKQEYLTKMMAKIGSNDVKNFPADDASFATISKLFEFYDNQSLDLKTTERSLNKELKEQKERLNNLNQELRKFIHSGPAKTVSVSLDSPAAEIVELELRYQVFGAGWRPSYDVRVEQKDNKSMQVTYSGRVSQNSGEDWSGCELVLSTAKPSVGGSIPELGTLDVQFYRPPPPDLTMLRAVNFREAPKKMKMPRMLDKGEADSLPEHAPVALQQAMAVVSEETLSTEFAVQRPAVILADGDEHKVTIGIASLKPLLSHECVPSKNNAVFLIANAINSSELPFLQGEAAIFLDGNFVTKSNLKAVSPGERFSVSLGVDSFVKIDYKPAHKLAGEVGLINKNATQANEQKIVIKNTKAVPILITVREHIPRSLDEKIKVKLLFPTALSQHESKIGEPKKEGVVVNSSHNIEWTVAVPPHHTKDLVLKWTIEYPGSEKLYFNEKY